MGEPNVDSITEKLRTLFPGCSVHYNEKSVVGQGWEFAVQVGAERMERVRNFINNQSRMNGHPTAWSDNTGNGVVYLDFTNDFDRCISNLEKNAENIKIVLEEEGLNRSLGIDDFEKALRHAGVEREHLGTIIPRALQR